MRLHLLDWLKALLSCAVLATLLAGCGGGGSSDGTAGDQPVAEAERNETTADVAVKYEELLAKGDAQPFVSLKQYMDTMPAFTETGVEDGAVWGRFKDGRYFVFSDEWVAVPQARSRSLQSALAREVRSDPAQEQKAPALQQSLASSSGPELPGSNKAVLLSLDDPADEAFVFGKGTITRVAHALTERGWMVNGTDPASVSITVEALKAASGAGVLYLNSHSAFFGPKEFWNGARAFSIMTDTKATSENEKLYEEDLDDHSLIYHRTRDLSDPRGLPRYAITPKFIQKHLKLAPNSLVVLMSCNGGASQGTWIQGAFLAAGAGTVIAWDGFANATGFAAVEALFDRMAGTNQTIPLFAGGELRPPAVPNRAFSFAEVWQFLESKGLLNQIGADAQHPAATIRKFGDGFIALSPVLKTFEVHGERFVAHGTFGSTPGKVTIGGVQVMPIWSNEKIEGVIAIDALGEVVIARQSLKSNSRVLGSWRGQVEYKDTQYDVSHCGSPYLDEFTVNVHIRADMHAVREVVDGPLLNNTLSTFFHVAPDSMASWKTSGECAFSDGTLEVRWKGSATFGFGTYTSGESIMTGRIDTVDGRFQLGMVTGPAKLKTAEHDKSTNTEPVWFNVALQGFQNPGPDYSQLIPFGAFIPFDASLHVIPGEQERIRADGKEKLWIRWGSFSVEPPLDEGVGR